MDQRVSMVTLGVADLQRAGAFYDALGWRRAQESTPGITFYQLPGMLLGLFSVDQLADDQGRPGATLGTGAMNLALNLNSRDDVDATFAEAVAAGATPLKKPQEVFWGGYSGYILDLDGHPWEFAHNPFAPLNDDGTLTLPSEAS